MMGGEERRSRRETHEALLLIGRVGKTHGVRGEVKVIPETDDPGRFAGLESVFMGHQPEKTTPHAVESVRFQQSRRGTTVVLKLAGIETIDEAAALRRLSVFALEDDLPPLAEGEYFLHDLIGLHVVTDQGEPVGKVREVLELPAHLVYVVVRPGKPDALIPAVPEFIAEVDLDASRIVVQPIDGLLD
ncbi:MAG: ribosome maturation factor RimM [Rhodothermales bacterium]